MHILHTEASPGWGGQEIRILREAEGMRERGHLVIMAINRHGKLIAPARKSGFKVYEVPFEKMHYPLALSRLMKIIKKHDIDIVNTHSSRDAWLGGIAARLLRRRVIRTRHLSTAIRSGLNSIALYNWLADSVVTTCSSVVEPICRQASLSKENCRSIPTGIDPEFIQLVQGEVRAFRDSLGICDETCLLGTACVLRSWKGISDFLKAAKILENIPKIKWLIVGGGVSENYFRREWEKMRMRDNVFFTGHLENPFPAMAAMDVFALLSTANEGVSQASLQAAYLKKPLITTSVGGLPEVCLDGKTGFRVNCFSPEEIVERVLLLSKDENLRNTMGEAAHRLVMERFTLEKTLDEMEGVYSKVR